MSAVTMHHFSGLAAPFVRSKGTVSGGVFTQKYVDVPELTPTIVNEYIKKIEVFAPDKSSGKRVQKVKIYFNFVDDVEIPVISEPVVAKSTPGRRKTA